MAKWNPEARQAFNKGVTKTNITRVPAKKLEGDIDVWAGTIGTARHKSFYPEASRAAFEVFAENREVKLVSCMP